MAPVPAVALPTSSRICAHQPRRPGPGSPVKVCLLACFCARRSDCMGQAGLSSSPLSQAVIRRWLGQLGPSPSSQVGQWAVWAHWAWLFRLRTFVPTQKLKLSSHVVPRCRRPRGRCTALRPCGRQFALVEAAASRPARSTSRPSQPQGVGKSPLGVGCYTVNFGCCWIYFVRFFSFTMCEP